MFRNFSPFIGFLIWLIAVPNTLQSIIDFAGKLNISNWQWWNYILAIVGTLLIIYGLFPLRSPSMKPFLGTLKDLERKFVMWIDRKGKPVMHEVK